MKRLFAIAAILLASTAAKAADSFAIDVGGHTVHIEAPDNCRSTDCVSVSVPGVYEAAPKRSQRPRMDRERAQEARYDLQQREKSQGKGAMSAASAVAATPSAPAPATARIEAPVAPSAAQPATAPVAAKPPAPPTVVAAAPVAAPVQKQQAPTPAARPANSPLGVWLTEEKEGKVRIEPCGANLCGYSVNAQTDANGGKVLINMKPGNDAKWIGRIFDPNSGSTYDSSIALKSPDSLRVEGCAFGGMFCGGQTWSRIN